MKGREKPPVKIEAISQRENKSEYTSLTIRYGIHTTRFGNVLIAVTERGICNLHFCDDYSHSKAQTILECSWPKAQIAENRTQTEELCNSIFSTSHSSKQRQLILLVRGTTFQIQVWRALLRIPRGDLVTYKTVADMIGRPTAARAVGNAIGQNPIGFLIPCHRVIRSSGEIGSYRWGETRKRIIIDWEGLFSERNFFKDTQFAIL